ncbi:MAG: hypothetical protein WKF84_03120 [Pyrinomonadaceae bacterium]
MINARTLYLCYFGLREPLVQTQVLPYLREIIKGGCEVFLLTFEPEFDSRWSVGEINEEKARLAGEGTGAVLPALSCKADASGHNA